MSGQLWVILLTLAASGLGHYLTRSWLSRLPSVHWRRAVRAALFLAAGSAMLNLSSSWIYPFLLGLAFGNLLPEGLPRE